jgi:hypothetical protein
LTKKSVDVHGAFEEANFIFEFPKEFELSKTSAVYWEGVSDEGFGDQKNQTVIKRDSPLSRRRWQFDERLEHFAIIGKEEN